MNGKRASLAWKAAAVVLFLAAVAGTAAFTIGAVIMFDRGYYSKKNSYFDSSICYKNILNYRDIVTDVLVLQRLLEREDATYLERQQWEQQLETRRQLLSRENTNFRFQVKSYDGAQVLLTNLEPRETLETATDCRWYFSIYLEGDRVSARLEMDGDYKIFSETSGDMTPQPDQTDPAQAANGISAAFENLYENTIGDSVPAELYDALWNSLFDYYTQQAEQQEQELVQEQEVVIVECGLPGTLAVSEDSFYQGSVNFYLNQGRFPWVIFGAAACAVLAVICLVFLCLGAGHKKGVEGIHLNWQDRIWYDVYLCLAGGAGALLLMFADSYWYWQETALEAVLLIGLVIVPLAALVLALLLTTVTRCKAGVLLSNTLIARLCGLCVWFVRVLPLTWKVVAGFFCYMLLVIALFSAFRYDVIFPLTLLSTAVMLYLCWWTVCFGRLRRAGEALAGGDLEYRVDTARMPGDLRSHGEALNNISGGMSHAVQEQMKSERFKAELITNVSHDLKTPLTSIINYVDLLKKVDIQNEKAREYIQVLDNKSQRLKKLTEDLVEASKASTGTLSVNREKLGMLQLINQALGEYEEKLEQKHLQLVTTLPESEVYVNADGRHLWRVLDNLLSNCCKYALEGTRVYLELARGRGQIVLSLKNISRDALNVPPEQLMERFVRGDKSRTTEGSGLGLSIARSLTELQGGVFEISVDGDLFKASVSLPQMV